MGLCQSVELALSWIEMLRRGNACNCEGFRMPAAPGAPATRRLNNSQHSNNKLRLNRAVGPRQRVTE